MTGILLSMENITKTFRKNSVKAVDSADLSVGFGEIHSIIGENGAGKSTLMHILAGELSPDSGKIVFENREIRVDSPHDALISGIGMLHQQIQLIPALTVLENIILGSEPSTRIGVLNRQEAQDRINRLCKDFDLYIDQNKTVNTLNADERQKTALLSILFHNIKLLILDEPTTFFSETKIDIVHKLIRKLKSRGKSIIIITHKLKEAIEISDRITVMKAGKTVTEIASSETSIDQLSGFILGGKAGNALRHRKIKAGSIILKVKDLTYIKDNTKRLKINFEVRKKEILVVTGIRENGLKILEQILSGEINMTSGEILYKGKNMQNNKAWLRETGAGYIPSDRIKTGTSIKSSISDNMILLKYRSLAKWGILQIRNIYTFSKRLIEEYGIKGKSSQIMATLSGGNIQRVMIAREIDTKPELFIFAEPSRGLDIKSRRLIYERIFDIKNEGSGVLIISSDMEEAIQLADSLIILHKGKEAATLNMENKDKAYIGKLMLGLEN